MKSGDYVCVEDASPYNAGALGMGLYLEDYQPSGSAKLEVMKEFMKKHSSKYLVDQYYTDFFGYVTTCFLKLVHSQCTFFLTRGCARIHSNEILQ